MAYPESKGFREYRAQGWRGGRARNRAVEVFRRKTWIALAATLAGALALGSASVAHAQSSLFGGGRLTATGGVSAVDGSAGGGINPWAMIAGYGTNRQIGGSVFYTHIALPNYGLNAYGATIGLFDRVELSYARQGFSLGNTGPQLDGAIAGFFGAPVSALPGPLQFGGNYTFNQDILGVKVRLFGDIVYDQGSLLPEVSIGMHYHHSENARTIRALGAHPDGSTFYIAASKLFLDGLFGRYTFVNFDLDFTDANQNGLLGFGGLAPNGSYRDQYHVEPAFSVAQFITRDVAIGYEFRAMPQNQLVGYNALGDAVSRTSDWQDVFVAWFPVKSVSVTAAYTRLGTIVSEPNQNGFYFSVSASF